MELINLILALAIYTIVIAVCFYHKGYDKAVKDVKAVDSLLSRIMGGRDV